MIRLKTLVPAPRVSIVLAVLWLWLNDSVAPGQLLLAAAAGLGIPWFVRELRDAPAAWPDPERFVRFLALLLWDIVRANFIAARQVLGPRSALRPRFVPMPVELESDQAVTLLASAVSLTPGTVSAELSPERDVLWIHSLSTQDEAELVRGLKDRYERRIKEMFT